MSECGAQTPVTSSPLVAGFLSNLPAYRIGVSPLLRGVEIGLVHGLLVTGEPVPAGRAAQTLTKFALLTVNEGPVRNDSKEVGADGSHSANPLFLEWSQGTGA